MSSELEEIPPRPEPPDQPSTFRLDPAAAAADLFADYAAPAPAPVPAAAALAAAATAAPPASFEIADDGPRPAPRALPARAGLGPQPRPAVRAAPVAVAYLLETPAWTNLWPLATLSLVLGWIVGGFLSFERMYPPGSVLPVLVLALGGVPVALVAMIHYLRPQRFPVVIALAVALFTAVVGIFLLLTLQSLADLAMHTRVRGRGSVIWAVLAGIGAAYDATNSEHVLVRWVGYVFGVGLCEEATKLLPLAALVMWGGDRRLSVHAFLGLGFVSGLGFGIGEAVWCYAPWSGVHGVDSNIIRWYSAVPSHAIYTTVCAAFLWYRADHLAHAEGFWERALVILMAAGVMALVHGTYNTVCSLGVVPSLMMEVVSFVLLIWAVRWVTVDATEPPGLPPSPWTVALAGPRAPRLAVAAAALLLVVAMACGSSREAVLPQILRAQVPEEWRPYLDGVTVTSSTSGTGLKLPLTVVFIVDPARGEIVGRFTNHGPPPGLQHLVLVCQEAGDEAKSATITVGDLPAGGMVEINEDRGWTFAPGERVTLQAEGFPAEALAVP